MDVVAGMGAGSGLGAAWVGWSGGHGRHSSGVALPPSSVRERGVGGGAYSSLRQHRGCRITSQAMHSNTPHVVGVSTRDGGDPAGGREGATPERPQMETFDAGVNRSRDPAPSTWRLFSAAEHGPAAQRLPRQESQRRPPLRAFTASARKSTRRLGGVRAAGHGGRPSADRRGGYGGAPGAASREGRGGVAFLAGGLSSQPGSGLPCSADFGETPRHTRCEGGGLPHRWVPTGRPQPHFRRCQPTVGSVQGWWGA